MRRRKCREQIFKLLFQEEFFEKEDYPEMIESSFDPREPEEEEDEPVEFSEEEKNYISAKFYEVVERKEELDRILNEASTDWTTARMGSVELTVLRLALYEMKEDADVPESVAINEAVELAKKYGGPESYAFVNGILSKCAQNQEKRKASTKKTGKPAKHKRVEPKKPVNIVVKKGSASGKE